MKQKYVLKLLLILLLPSMAFGQNYGMAEVFELRSVKNALGFRVDLKDYKALAGQDILVRALGAEIPQLKGKCRAEKEKAMQGKEFTQKTLNSAKLIELHNMRRGKRFRIDADVMVDGSNLAQLLLDAQLARIPGQKDPVPWCKERKKAAARKL